MLFIPAEPFLAFVDAHPKVALRMLGEMAQRLREAVRQLDAVTLQDVQGRLARYLSEQMPAATEPPTIELDIPKSVLAAELGTVPETLSRALRSLEEDDLIQSDASTITIADPEGLRRKGDGH
jgi:CRP/FNR family transcriptional regulator